MKYPAKQLSILLCISIFQIQLLAQDKLPIKFGKVTVADFDVKSPLIDSGTNAVVVAHVGKSEFVANAAELTFSLLFKDKKRIKIINKNGFDAATVSISLYIGDNGKSEKLEDLDAYTYNLENGKVVQTKLEKSAVFTEKASKNFVVKKFTFPAVKEGSIIEYAYEVKSDFIFNFQPWSFQGQYPVLWSQYDANIPEFFKYVILSQGYQPFFINKVDAAQISFSFVEHVEREGGTYLVTSSGLKTHKVEGSIDYHTWVMKNVPGLKEEAYTTTIDNSIAKMDFQLKEIAYPRQLPEPVMNTWEKASRNLLEGENFGVPIKRANNWLDAEMPGIIKTTTLQKEKAKKIYEYLRDNFTCTNYNRFYTSAANLKDVFKDKSGTVADINMLLIAMLRNQKITADPVILSTRSHGVTNELYPLMDKYNYVVAQVTINDQIYYLDAARPRLAFNKLPLQAYNGHARVINEETTPVFFIADSLNESSSTIVFISNMDKGGVEGSFANNLGYYQSLDLRNQLAKTNIADYKKSLQESYPEETTISNIQVDSLKLLDEPVSLKFDMQLKSFGDADIVYFSPMLGEAIKKNPFAAAERFYPVEMPYTIDDIYTLNMDIPKGYQVDELPKSARIKLNDDEGMFEYLISNTGENIQMRCRLVLKKATYSNEDYQSLRDFYGFVVSKEAEQIVFKKIK